MPTQSQAPRYDLLQEYVAGDGISLGDATNSVIDRHYIGTSSDWAIAVIRLGRPVSYSRKTMRSMGEVIEGAFTRKAEPLIIHSDVLKMTVQNHKSSHTKTLQAQLKGSVNYLSEDSILGGDWVLAWCWNNREDGARVLRQVKLGLPANNFNDGLKFVGRVHSIRKNLTQNGNGPKEVRYNLQAIGFDELDTQFFYDFGLATAAAVKNDIRQFMAQLGLDFSAWSEQEQQRAGRIKDNADVLIPTLVDMVLGKGVSARVNRPTERAVAAQRQANPSATNNRSDDLKPSPQASKEAPFGYLVPVSLATLLGREVAEKSKGNVFGYADVLDTLIGVQEYAQAGDGLDDSWAMFYPKLDTSRSTPSRKYTTKQLKGTFLPVNPSFVNRPLWTMLQQFLNPAINEMFTSLRVNEVGAVVPTIVVRQIPFSTEAMSPNVDFPLTKFLSLPRWVVDPVMVTGLDIGRSNATRVNMIHVYGEATVYAANRSITNQMVRNPPIFDQLDIQRSGIKAIMKTVNCALADQVRKDGARVWMEAIADWTFGSHHTLNGSLQVHGIQSPIAEGDNIEFEKNAYQIEGYSHNCEINDGGKSFKTMLELSNGMPVDQSEATADSPRYPGFHNFERSTTRRGLDVVETETFGDDEESTQLDPELTISTEDNHG